MPQDFYSKLETLLKKDSRFVDQDGDLLKSNVIDCAYKADKNLIELLLSQNELKKKFFIKIKDTLVFNINDFVAYIQDKNFLADSYTKYRNKIGLNIDDKFLNERKEIALVWPFKDCVLEGGMTKEDEKRKEIFFNEILAQDEIDKLLTPKVLTSWKRYTQDGEIPLNPPLKKGEAERSEAGGFKRDENGTIRENLIIKGNNLLALHSLKQQFQNKVKLIYIDPPYNTGGDAETFTYNNNFDHSTWLTFMKNRLEVARDFLREDGFIAIAIDHFELFYLGALADEIFGRDNRLGVITVVHKPEGRNQEKFFGTSNEFMLVYAKNIKQANFRRVVLDKNLQQTFNKKDKKGKYRLNNFIRLGGGDDNLRKNKSHFFYPVFVSDDLKTIRLNKTKGFREILPITNSGQERTWKTIKKTLEKLVEDGEIVAEKDEKGKIQIFEKYRENQVIKTHWTDSKYHAIHHGTNLLENILGAKQFSYPKSLYLVIDTLKLMTENNDIILDFFAGSGTTGHATLELNKEDGGDRKFILVEQLEEHIKVCKERIQKVIKLAKDKNLFSRKEEPDFVYCELMEYNERFVEKIKKADTTQKLLNIWKDMKEKSFLNYNVDIKKFDETVDEFKKFSLAKQKRILFDFLNKNQLYVGLSEIEDREFGVGDGDKRINEEFYKD